MFFFSPFERFTDGPERKLGKGKIEKKTCSPYLFIYLFIRMSYLLSSVFIVVLAERQIENADNNLYKSYVDTEVTSRGHCTFIAVTDPQAR